MNKKSVLLFYCNECNAIYFRCFLFEQRTVIASFRITLDENGNEEELKLDEEVLNLDDWLYRCNKNHKILTRFEVDIETYKWLYSFKKDCIKCNLTDKELANRSVSLETIKNKILEGTLDE